MKSRQHYFHILFLKTQLFISPFKPMDKIGSIYLVAMYRRKVSFLFLVLSYCM